MAEIAGLKGLDKARHGKLIDFLTTSFKAVDIGGKQVIQTPDGEFIEYVLMDEEYFVANWLTQFAIGHVGETNYFNHQEWSRITDGFTKGAIILNSDKEPTCIIRKFIDMDLSTNLQAVMDHYARQAGHAINIPDKGEQDQIINSFADIATKVAEQNPEYDTLTAMIPFDYYLRHGINPNVVKQVIYIRDNFTYKDAPIEADSELMTKIEQTLYKNSRGDVISNKDKALIEEITQGQFIFNGDDNKVDTKVSVQSESTDPVEMDPLAD